ncbi:MAG: nucleotide exchange factor GrpE [Thermoplasmatota archaeon]
MAGKDQTVREPNTEIQETPEGAKLTAELPGVAQDAIRIAVSKDILKLEAEGTRGKFSTIQALPFEPDPDGISVSFSQGVLEVLLGRKHDDTEHVGEKQVPVLSTVDASIDLLEKELDQLRNELLKVSGERASLEERAAFLQRDFQNLKRRHEAEKDSIADRKIEEISTGLIEVLDSFKLAKASIKGPGKTENSIEQTLKGIEMIENQVQSLFRKIGITSMSVEGQHFDHNFHEAVGNVERKDLEDDVVASEVKTGYIYKGRTLRPAQVIVNRKPPVGKEK